MVSWQSCPVQLPSLGSPKLSDSHGCRLAAKQAMLGKRQRRQHTRPDKPSDTLLEFLQALAGQAAKLELHNDSIIDGTVEFVSSNSDFSLTGALLSWLDCKFDSGGRGNRVHLWPSWRYTCQAPLRFLVWLQMSRCSHCKHQPLRRHGCG